MPWSEAAACVTVRRGGLAEFEKRRAQGGARLTLARSLWGNGLCCTGRRAYARARGGLPFDN